MESLLVVAMWLFVVTHVDTLVVLVAFCTDEEYHTTEVAVGHYVGFGLGLAVALLAAFLAAEFFREQSFLLGALPLALGVRGLLRKRSEETPPPSENATGRTKRIGIVATAGFGLSGENVAIYVPFFLTLEPSELGAVVAAYLVGAVVVFLAASLMARRAVAFGPPRWIDRFLVPAMLVLVGGYVLVAGWVTV